MGGVPVREASLNRGCGSREGCGDGKIERGREEKRKPVKEEK